MGTRLQVDALEKIMQQRNMVLPKQQQRILQPFEDFNEDCLTVAGTIGVNRSTVRRIVARYLREVGYTGGLQRKKQALIFVYRVISSPRPAC